MPNEDQTGEILSSQSCNGTLVGLVHEAWDCKGCLTRARAKVSGRQDCAQEMGSTNVNQLSRTMDTNLLID